MCVQTVARLKEASGWSIVGHEQGFERTKTILLVEDEPFVREVTGEVLRAAGYRVLTAKNAKEGASLYEAQSGEVELLLTDIILPEGYGERSPRSRCCLSADIRSRWLCQRQCRKSA